MKGPVLLRQAMESIISKLNENLQVLYRKAIDADRALVHLASQGQAKHKAIFPENAGFTTSSNRFAPYLEELTQDINALTALQEKDETKFNPQLSAAVKKMEALFVTLAQFKGSLAE